MAKHAIGCTLGSLAIPDTVGALEAVRRIGFDAVQFSFQEAGDTEPAGLARIREALDRTGLAVPAGLVSFDGEDWSSIASIRQTGGFVDAARFPARLKRCRACGEAMARLPIRHVTLHAGFLPEPGRPHYRAVCDRLGAAADALHEFGLTVGLETGQESAAVLLCVLRDLDRPYVSVNFDPANFILYGSDDPVKAARLLAERVSMVHMKDALPSDRPGEVWGQEVPLGSGRVDLAGVLEALEGGGFAGALVVEREGGSDRLTEVAAARRFVMDLLREKPAAK
jgi:sugar phosphate isomerase/epimerase